MQSAPLAIAQDGIAEAARWLKLGLETAAALLIAYGATAALVQLFRRMAHADTGSFVQDRLVLGRYLTWALEFQLAGDILDTAIAPTWKEIGEVAAIAAIRTALNFALSREMRDEQNRLDRAAATAAERAEGSIAAPTSNGGSSARG